MSSCSPRCSTETGTERLHKTSFSLSIIHQGFTCHISRICSFCAIFDRPLFFFPWYSERRLFVAACVELFFHFSFLKYSPFCSPNTFFFCLYTFQWHWDNQIWDDFFSLPLASATWKPSHELLAILSLILHINLDLGSWNLSVGADVGISFSCTYLRSLSLPASLCILCFCLLRLFSFLVTSVQMHDLCSSAMWPCRFGCEAVNEMSRSFISQFLFIRVE